MACHDSLLPRVLELEAATKAIGEFSVEGGRAGFCDEGTTDDAALGKPT